MVAVLHVMPDLRERFRLHLGDRKRSLSTVQRYLAVLDAFTAFLRDQDGGLGALEMVTTEQVLTFLRAAAGTEAKGGGSSTAWNLALASLRAFYRFMLVEKLVSGDPTATVERQRVQSQEVIPLSLDEFLRLFDQAGTAPIHRALRDQAILLIFFHDLLRVSELVSLDLEHVDLQEHLLLDVHTKGAKRLSLEFPDVVAEALEKYLARRADFGPAEGDGALFLSNRGTRLSKRTVQQLLRNLARRAGITRPVFPHLLRHTGSSEYDNLGASLEVIGSLAGHRSTETTKRYVHSSGRARRIAVDRLGAVMKKRLAARKGRR
jgi:site-specific recombinase XerD